MEIRPATQADAPQMAALLNEIIEIGGTTAYTAPVTSDYIAKKMARDADRAAWHVADSEGSISGFQWIAPHSDLPPQVCDIATFAKAGVTQRGIGTSLFARTRARAKALGYTQINANIRADNSGGLTFYARKGFLDFGRISGIEIGNGLVVDKVIKRLVL